jgi:(p)ppGpp synthase/HD superfamily hydrolase
MMKKIAMFLLLFCSAQLFYAQNTNTSDYNMRKAYEMLDKNDEKEALKYINQQLKDDPASSDAYTLRARIFFNNENYGSALTDINRAIKVQPNDKLLQNNPLRLATDSDSTRLNRHAINGVIVEDIDSCMIKFAKCCTPVPGDPIVGFITKGFGVSVHRDDCPNTLNRCEPHQAARWVKVRWANQDEQPFETTLELDCMTRDGLLLDIATAMTTARVRVKELSGKDVPGGHSVFTIRFEVRNVSELEAIRNRLQNIRDVIGTRRGQN